MRTVAWMIRGGALLFFVAAIGSGCGGSSEGTYSHPQLIAANAFSGEVPDSARDLDPRAFGSMLDRGRLTLVTMDDLEAERESKTTRLLALRVLAESLYADRMDVLSRLAVEPHDGLPGFTALPHGDWSFDVSEDQQVVLPGLLMQYQTLVESTQRFRSRENQVRIYETLYERLDPDYVLERKLPDSADIANYTYEEVLDLNLLLARDWPAFYPSLGVKKPAGYPASAEDEEGWGGGIDTARYPDRVGLAGRVDFPLKWFVTSVKDQGRRGSCTAFGITAAVELMIARDQGRWVNLSEQMLYNRAKQEWEGSNFGDGYPPSKMLFEMMLYLYQYSWERSWDYNRSPIRMEYAPTEFYGLSCLYPIKIDKEVELRVYSGEHCSDTNHQASMFTTNVGGLDFTAFIDPESDVPPDAGFRILIGDSICDPGVVGTIMAIAMLSLDVPVIISVTMPSQGMDGETVKAADGVVTYSETEPAGTGAHCMLLVGFIPNALLPEGMPASPGMGYFICKNSWGWRYGDGGFLYLPDPWVMRWANGLYTVSRVY